MATNEIETRTQSATVRITDRDLGMPELSDFLMTLEWTGRLMVFAATEHPDKMTTTARRLEPMYFHELINTTRIQVHSLKMASPLEATLLITAMVTAVGGAGSLLAHRIMGVMRGWQRVRNEKAVADITSKEAQFHRAVVDYLISQMESKGLKAGSVDIERMAQVIPIIDKIEVEEP